MSRRQKNPGFFEMLVDLPWWEGVICAVLAYFLIGIMAPSMWAANPILTGLVSLCPLVAGLAFLLCLIAAGVSAVRSPPKFRSSGFH